MANTQGTKCPACGYNIEKDAWLCTSCGAHICFLCRDFCLYENDPQYECKIKGCELKGKRVCHEHIFIPRPLWNTFKWSAGFGIAIGLISLIKFSTDTARLFSLVSFVAIGIFLNEEGLKEGEPCCKKCKNPYEDRSNY